MRLRSRGNCWWSGVKFFSLLENVILGDWCGVGALLWCFRLTWLAIVFGAGLRYGQLAALRHGLRSISPAPKTKHGLYAS